MTDLSRRIEALSPGRRVLLERLLVVDATDRPADGSVPRLFTDQAARTPDAVALIGAEGPVSFRNLDERVNQLAHYLRTRGVGAETVVGVLLGRSVALSVALLAVQRCGGAALPIDPMTPPVRVRSLLSRAGAHVILTDGADLGHLQGEPADVIDLHAVAADIARQSQQDPAVPVAADQLACVLFTSGSTGRPKGVCVTHRQVLNRLAWMWEAYPFRPEETSCQRAPVGFVDMLWDQWGPMLRGVPSVVVSDDVGRDPFHLVRFLGRHRVTRVLLVPTLLRVLLDAHDDLADRLPDLRVWVSSGEPLAADLHALFVRRLPGRLLVNVYGASEAWDATFFEPGPGPPPTRSVPAGRPIAGMRVRLLDQDGRSVPAGATGEVHLGGAGLARGYVGAPDLTAERFVPDPAGFGERLYRTGDLGRYLPDGTLELLGRADQQLTLRGYRIEPAEIEAVLGRHPGVGHCVVSLTGAPTPELTAFVVAASPGTVDPGEIRDLLRQQLPSHLRPTRIVPLVELPRTSSGKVDRRALAEERGGCCEPTPDGAATAG